MSENDYHERIEALEKALHDIIQSKVRLTRKAKKYENSDGSMKNLFNFLNLKIKRNQKRQEIWLLKLTHRATMNWR